MAAADPALRTVREIVAHAATTIERRLYAFEDVCARFCCRTGAEVAADGHIHYATPCHDLATLAGEMLRGAGFQPVPVLCRIHRVFQPVKFQCGLELELAGEAWYVGFSVTTSRVARGRFAPGRSRTAVLRAAWDAAPAGAPHLSFFGVESPAGVDRLFAGHDLAKHLRSYRAGATLRAFERARRRALEKENGPDKAELCGAGRFVAKGARDA